MATAVTYLGRVGSLPGMARILAVGLFVLFAALLWQTIEVGSANTSFQHTSVQIEQFEVSVRRLQAANREAEVKYVHASSNVQGGTVDAAAVPEADRARIYAASDLEAEAGRYFAAVCDAGARLAKVGGLAGRFLPATTTLGTCPQRSVNLAPGQTSPTRADQLSPPDYVQAVTVVLDRYAVLANSYVLPILFGMLGALIFAIRDMVVAPDHMGDMPIVIGHVLRLFLGAIFGLIVGYVNFAPTPASGLAASPLLFSLVGGYATDAVLSILDRIGSAMSYGDGRPGLPSGSRPRSAPQDRSGSHPDSVIDASKKVGTPVLEAS